MKKRNVLLATLMCAVMAVTGCADSKEDKSEVNDNEQPKAVSTSAATKNGLAKKTGDGAILHCWCWSFNSIKDNMSEIAASGFTSIQTSPISQCLEGDNGGMQIVGNGKWYYHYQPVKYTIGNYQMGTEEEFKSMCEEAHKYGIKVIVDTVINHCTSNYDAIDSSLKDIEGGGFHDVSANWSETDRYEETQCSLSNLYDLNTQNENVQKLIQDFLKKCVEDGADGFRYDAAKLIELPDDKSDKYDDFASDFWPTVLENGATFQYGEDLLEGGAIEYSTDMKGGFDDQASSRLSDYQKYMNTTASLYGFRIRDAITNDNVTASFVEDYLMPQGADASKVVTWVESHDNYCNNSSYLELDEQQVIEGYAILAARAKGTPLYFDRPDGSSASTPWGNNLMGVPGSSSFKDIQVSQVNFFRNYYGSGASEKLTNPNDNTKVVMIERGHDGVVIVNTSDEDVILDGASMTIDDGNYIDRVSGASFDIKDGKMAGTIKAGKVVVIFPEDENAEYVEYTPVVECSLLTGNILNEENITLKQRGCSKTYYQLGDGKKTEYTNGDVITIGSDMKNDDKITLKLTGTGNDGNEVVNSYEYTKKEVKGTTIVYFDSSAIPEWSKVYAYVYSGGGDVCNAGWPGAPMEKGDDGIYSYVLPFELESLTSNVIFNNGNGGVGNQLPTGAGFTINSEESKIYNADGWQDYTK